MRPMILGSSLFVMATLLAITPAQAQQPAPTGASVTGAYSGHGRGIGVGAITMLNGTSGAMFTWGNGLGSFHIDALLGMHRYRSGNGNYTSDVSFGGRFWYHMHAASYADFSLGGGIGFTDWTSNPGAPGSDTHLDVSLEIGGQIRAFIVSNVALIADLGFGATLGNNDNMMFGGQSVTGSGSPEGGANFVSGTLGIAYFFE
jgi:hypothetical protein